MYTKNCLTFVFLFWSLQAHSTASSTLQKWSWNALLQTPDLFEEDLNTIIIQSKSGSINVGVVLAELEELLGHASILNSLYTRYTILFENKRGRNNSMVFREKLMEIAKHNLEEMEGKHSWTQGVNMFTDMKYSNGVFDAVCDGVVNHAVLIVGFGKDKDKDNGKDFWLIKNSWGPKSGLRGFIKLARGKNLCHVALQGYIVKA